MKKCLAMLLMLVLLAAPLSAMAATVVEVKLVPDDITFLNHSNTYVRDYTLYDLDGNPLSVRYSRMTPYYDYQYAEVRNEGDLNNIGVISTVTGAEVLPMAYGDVDVLSDRWIAGIYLGVSTDPKAPYRSLSNGQRYDVERVDLYWNGKLVAQLSRDEYSSARAYGDYLCFTTDNSILWVGYDGSRVECERYADYRQESYKGVHNGSQQQMFVPGCTLTADQVTQQVAYTDMGDLIDLQGNVISNCGSDSKEYDDVEQRGNHLRASVYISDVGYVYGLLDLQGNVIIPVEYSVLRSGTSFFNEGYEAVLDEANAKLYYYNSNGAVTAEVDVAEIGVDAVENQIYNGQPYMVVETANGNVLITAEAGILDASAYEEIESSNYGGLLIPVKKDGLWGVIDLKGNTVVPFVCAQEPEISLDSTLVVAETEDSMSLYVVSHDPLAERQAVVCMECGYTPDPNVKFNFCPMCGTKF